MYSVKVLFNVFARRNLKDEGCVLMQFIRIRRLDLLELLRETKLGGWVDLYKHTGEVWAAVR